MRSENSWERAPLSGRLDDVPSDDATQNNLDGAFRRVGIRLRSRRIGRRFATAIGLVAMVLLGHRVGLSTDRSSAPTAHLATRFEVDADGRSRVTLEDGSWIAVEHGAVETLIDRADHIAFRLDGEAVFEVTPGLRRRWTVRTRDLDVMVLGTRFGVRADVGAPTQVWVERGTVKIIGDATHGQAQRLEAGSRWTDDPVVGSAPVVSNTPTDFVSPAQTAPHADPPITPRSSSLRQPRPIEVVAVDVRSDVETLLLDADRAERVADHTRAIALLDRVIAEHRDRPEAALAAFTLARIQMDSLGEFARAREALRMARELGVPSALRDDLDARMRALDRIDANDAHAE